MNSKKIIKPVLIIISVIIGLSIVLFVGYMVLIAAAFGDFDKNYNTKDLIENFNNNKQQIYLAKQYFNSIVPKYKKVSIEFDGKKISRFEIDPIDTGRGSDLTTNFLDWNLSPHKTDSVIATIGWTKETIDKLQQKLKDADCISIENGEPAQIGFKRNGMGMYFFVVFDKPIPDTLKARYNDSCTYVYANKYLVLEYGGGAVGNQCFFNKSINR